MVLCILYRATQYDSKIAATNVRASEVAMLFHNAGWKQQSGKQTYFATSSIWSIESIFMDVTNCISSTACYLYIEAHAIGSARVKMEHIRRRRNFILDQRRRRTERILWNSMIELWSPLGQSSLHARCIFLCVYCDHFFLSCCRIVKKSL